MAKVDNRWHFKRIRPATQKFFLTKYLSLAFEGGFDHTHRTVDSLYDGWVPASLR